MAIENKRMQQRYGTYAEFQANKGNLLPHEFASVVSGDTNSVGGKSLHFSFGASDVRKVMTEEETNNLVKNVINSEAATLDEIKEYIK